MSQEWGRNEYAGEWPNRHPLWRYAAIFLALVSMAAVVTPVLCPRCHPISRSHPPRSVPLQDWGEGRPR